MEYVRLADHDIEHMPPMMIASPQRNKYLDDNGAGRGFGAELGMVVVGPEKSNALRRKTNLHHSEVAGDLARQQWLTIRVTLAQGA